LRLRLGFAAERLFAAFGLCGLGGVLRNIRTTFSNAPTLVESDLAMNADLLVGTKLKINRAKKHLAELSAEISAYHGRNPYRIISDKESKPGHELYRIEFIEAIPLEWGTMVGDVIHNLRAALDTLATALVIANGKTSRSVIKNTYFPIGSTQKLFDQKLPKDLRGASDVARQIVQRLKPYKGGTDAFWRLHQLDILDKHTLLIPVGAGHTRVLWKVGLAGFFEQMGVTDPAQIPDVPPIAFTPAETGYPLKNGDIIFSYGFGPDKEEKNKGDLKFTLGIAFGEGQIVDGQPVVPSLQQLIDFTERVVGIFENRTL
jgi:hypothetical protein